MTSASYTINMPMPNIGGADKKLDKNIAIFDFWNDDFDTSDKGIIQQPLILNGIIAQCGEDESDSAISTKIENIWTIQNNGEEVTISGITDCINAVYIIKNFRFATVPRQPGLFIWQLVLEKVRDS
jgi:hypothetical protein